MPVHLVGQDGGYAVMPLAWIDPQTAAWADHAIVRRTKAVDRARARAARSRGLELRDVRRPRQLQSADGSVKIGTATTIQLGVLPRPAHRHRRLDLLRLARQRGQRDAVRVALHARGPGLSGRRRPAARRPLRRRRRAPIAGKTRIPGGNAGSIALIGGAMLQLDFNTRIALTARFGQTYAHGERMSDLLLRPRRLLATSGTSPSTRRTACRRSPRAPRDRQISTPRSCGGRAVPLRQAVPAEPREVHDVDVLDVGALAEVLHQPAERRGLDLGARLIGNVGHAPMHSHVVWKRAWTSARTRSRRSSTAARRTTSSGPRTSRSAPSTRSAHVIERGQARRRVRRARQGALRRADQGQRVPRPRRVQGRPRGQDALPARAPRARRAISGGSARALGVKPGAELLAAVDAANEQSMPYELIDRDINITLKRTWTNLGLWKRIDAAVVAARRLGATRRASRSPRRPSRISRSPRRSPRCSTELGKAVPEVKGPLVDERDQYLVEQDGRGRRGQEEGGRGRRRRARAGHDRRTSASRSIARRSTGSRRRR